MRGKSAIVLSSKVQRNALPDDSVKNWWSLSGSNRPPRACKARALPDELKPQKLAYYAVSSDRNFQNLCAFKIFALRDTAQFHRAVFVLDVNGLF